MKHSHENSFRNKIRLDNTCATPAETLAGQPPTLKLSAWSAMCWTTGWIKRQNHAYTDRFFSARVQLFAVFLRTSANLTTTRQLVTRTMEQIDPELPVYGVTTMNELVSNSMARRRLALFLMSTFAALALFLASLGIYGVTAFLVKQRVQEFGIRMALGAQIRDILVLAVRPGLVLVSIGAAAGLVVSMFVTRVMSSLLFAVSSTDLFTFITVPLVLAVIAVIACLIPARYATRISPAEALRH